MLRKYIKFKRLAEDRRKCCCFGMLCVLCVALKPLQSLLQVTGIRGVSIAAQGSVGRRDYGEAVADAGKEQSSDRFLVCTSLL